MSKCARNGKSTRGQSSSSREPIMEDKVNLFQIDEPVYRELVWKFFASIEFDFVAGRYDPKHLGVSFRLGGESRTLSLLEFGWREQLRLTITRSGLRRGETVKANHVLMGFWPSIGDREFVMEGIDVKKVRDLRVRLAHHCIATTILGKKESTHRITTIDLFYLYCIYGEGVTCNIPYWLARYLKEVRDKDLICGGMFVTRIARSFVLLTNAMVDALSVEPQTHVFKKKSLIAMGVVMELGGGTYCWPTTRQVKEDDEA
uniref:Retrotransposon Orf1 n=1 Tax=Tanacetum cinerariifolium TaxID=118510 RepID=A0A6L2NMU2_TANCI|nr:retrotransposon Orf1 [Tanacetum cinerariifolium]